MASIQVQELCRDYGPSSKVGPISLDIKSGEFFSLLGPSGCGKSTTLRCIAGFEQPDQGEILIAGKSVRRLPAHKRNIGIVFQSFALFPHLTVLGNVMFGLRLRKIPGAQAKARARAALISVGLDDYGDRYPAALSGGQQQRVAIARAIVLEPPVLLMDEPLSSLDLQLRVQMRGEIRALQRRLGLTVVYVTHDQDEALSMSDRLAVMSQGAVQQIGAPREIYEQPASEAVATFIGTANIFTLSALGEDDGGTFGTLPSGLSIRLGRRAFAHPPRLALRPERICIEPDAQGGGDNLHTGTIERLDYLGGDLALNIRLSDKDVVAVSAKNIGHLAKARIGDRLRIGFSSHDLVPLPVPGN
ncbi:MAG TPA: ABC transporter ATP-binding protein [Bordetella sp.]